jgi:hypothetical protein
MMEIDPWERAAECERAARQEEDPYQRELLTSLRNLWIALANERALMTVAEVADEIASLSRIETDLAQDKRVH